MTKNLSSFRKLVAGVAMAVTMSTPVFADEVMLISEDGAVEIAGELIDY